MKKKNYKISVIVAVYNAHDYLEQCIDSILLQTYENLELLLIDDESTDGSGAICDRYADQDAAGDGKASYREKRRNRVL